MLSYPIPEAEELLSNKLSAAQQSLSNCEEDLDFLREQVTVRGLKPPSNETHTNTTFNPIWWLTIYADNGSRHRARIQLGHLAEAQGGEGQWKQLERLSYQNLSSRGFIKHRLHDTNKDCCWQLENTRTAPFRSEFPHQAKSVTRF